MNKLEGFNNHLPVNRASGHNELLALYDQFGATAYGIILQIVPQENFAQEILVDVFSKLSVNDCLNSKFSIAMYIIQQARSKAIDAKKRISNADANKSQEDLELNDLIFELSFKQGKTPESIAHQLSIPKEKVLKAIHEYFKSFRQA